MCTKSGCLISRSPSALKLTKSIWHKSNTIRFAVVRAPNCFGRRRRIRPNGAPSESESEREIEERRAALCVCVRGLWICVAPIRFADEFRRTRNKLTCKNTTTTSLLINLDYVNYIDRSLFINPCAQFQASPRPPASGPAPSSIEATRR